MNMELAWKLAALVDEFTRAHPDIVATVVGLLILAVAFRALLGIVQPEAD